MNHESNRNTRCPSKTRYFRYSHKGYGKLLLIWAMDHIASSGDDELILHVAEWNRSAVQMYKNEGFGIVKTDVISV